MPASSVAAILFAAPALLAQIPASGYASYLGGRSPGYGNEHVFSIAVDSTGAAYAVGSTESSVPPNTRKYGTAPRGGFLTRINPNGTERVYTTFFEDLDLVAVKIASDTNIFVLGQVGRGPQPFLNLGAHAGGYTDAVLLKIAAENGELLWGRYFGGGDLEIPRALALDSLGNAYVAGYTTSTNLPATPGAAQPAFSGGFDAFVAKFNSAGDVLYATYLGGEASENAFGLTVDSFGRAIVTGGTVSSTLAGRAVGSHFGPGVGTDAFVCRLNAQGSAVDWFTKFGGDARETGISVEIAPNGDLVVLGITESANFPVASSTLQAGFLAPSDLFVARLSAEGAEFKATYLGGADGEQLGDPFYVQYTLDGSVEERTIFPETAGLAVASNGDLLVAAHATSRFWPALEGIPVSYGGSGEAYLARIASDLSRVLDFRFFGSASEEILRTVALDADGNAYLGGTIFSPWIAPFLVTTPGAFQPEFGGSVMDGLVIKVPAAAGALTNDAFANATLLVGERTSGLARIDEASLETGEPAHLPATAKSVWFKWRAAASGRAIASTTGSSFDAGLDIYTGTNLSSLQRIARLVPPEERLSFAVTAGTEYSLALISTSASGLGRLSIALSLPPNDAFTNALPLAGFPVSAEGANIGSTAEPGEPAHDQQIPARSVWWKWTSPTNASVAISTAESSFDTVLAIYAGSDLQTLEPLVSSDDVSAEDRTSEAVFLAQTGATYFIAVDGPPDETGTIRLRIVSNDPPLNDNFTNAAPLAGFSQQITASNLRATFEPGEPPLLFTNSLGEVNAAFSRSSVWWTWLAPAAGHVRIDTIGSDFDTRLGVYIGTALGNLQLVASHDDIDRATAQRASRVEFETQPGGPYYIQVDGTTGDTAGIIKLNLRLTFPPRIFSQTLFRAPDGSLRFRADGVPGTAYRYETSPDLKNWSPSAETFTDSNGVWDFIVPASAAARTFVRLSAPE